MRIGILSDVHANLSALKQALAFLESQNVDQIICAGDLVDRGFQNEEVVARIKAEKIPTVKGNHDYAAQRSRSFSSETLEFLISLPDELRFEWEGRKIYMTHAAPWSKMQYIFPHSYDHLFLRIIHHAQADIVILGHTHQPMRVTLPENHMIINPGTTNPDASYGSHGGTCGILTLDDEVDFTVYAVATGEPITPAEVNITV